MASRHTASLTGRQRGPTRRVAPVARLTSAPPALDTERARVPTPVEGDARMPKPELEFFAPDHISWQPVAGSATGGAGGPGVDEKVLAVDPETGDVTRLLRFAAGVETKETITHDFWEE